MDIGSCPSLPPNRLDADELRPNVHIAVSTTAFARRSALCSLNVLFINIGNFPHTLHSFSAGCLV